LKRQAPKRRKKDEKDENDADGRAPMSFVRMISTVKGTRLAIPDQWLEAPVGEIFKQSEKSSMNSAFPQKMVEEVS
jgi:Ino eighty subunit 2